MTRDQGLGDMGWTVGYEAQEALKSIQGKPAWQGVIVKSGVRRGNQAAASSPASLFSILIPSANFTPLMMSARWRKPRSLRHFF